MRTAFLTIAAAASAVAFAAPASAQWYPQPRGPAYGYHQIGAAHQLGARINQIQRQIINLDRRNILSNREARQLHNQSRDVERRLIRASRNGLTNREIASLHTRVQRLEQRVWREANDRNRQGRYYGYRR